MGDWLVITIFLADENVRWDAIEIARALGAQIIWRRRTTHSS
jgi:hypothetical protein